MDRWLDDDEHIVVAQTTIQCMKRQKKKITEQNLLFVMKDRINFNLDLSPITTIEDFCDFSKLFTKLCTQWFNSRHLLIKLYLIVILPAVVTKALFLNQKLCIKNYWVNGIL